MAQLDHTAVSTSSSSLINVFNPIVEELGVSACCVSIIALTIILLTVILFIYAYLENTF